MRRGFARRIILNLLVGTAVISGALGAQAQIQVSSAVPNSTAQGTVNLSVVVNGSGFKKGAQAQWFVSGTTNPGGVTVNSTAFNSASQLTANITVAADAYVGGFDIQVLNSDGRTGKGTELFAVNTTNSSAKQGSLCPAQTPLNPPVTRSTGPMCANSGCADASFNGTGFVLTNTDGNISEQTDIDFAAAVQQVTLADGTRRIMAIGATSSTTGVRNGVALVRYNDDGSLDTAFGTNGVVKEFLPSASTQPTDGILDSNGNVVVLSNFYSANEAYVLRFHPDGTLDSSFNGTGISPALNTVPWELSLDPNGNILVAGTAYVSTGNNKTATYGALFRLTANGAIDSGFGTNGRVLFTSVKSVDAVAIETVNSIPYILVGGGAQVFRLTMNGALDPSFAGGTGYATTNLCGYGYVIYGLKIDQAGNILAIGNGPLVSGGADLMAVTRFTSGGMLDTTFGAASSSGSGRTGFSLLDVFGSGNTAKAAVVLNDGSGDFAISGSASTPGFTGSTYYVIAKFDSTGALVPAFNGDGVVALDWGGGSNFSSGRGDQGLLIEPTNGRFVVGTGSGFASGTYAGYNFALARVWP